MSVDVYELRRGFARTMSARRLVQVLLVTHRGLYHCLLVFDVGGHSEVFKGRRTGEAICLLIHFGAPRAGATASKPDGNRLELLRESCLSPVVLRRVVDLGARLQ